MKRKKLLRKIKELLNEDQRAQVAKYASLEKVLKKLEEKESAFREKLKAEDDTERRQDLVRKLEVIEAQRKKGESLKQELDSLREPE